MKIDQNLGQNFKVQSDVKDRVRHTGASPFINQPFDIIQKFFDINSSYILQIRKIRKIRKMLNLD